METTDNCLLNPTVKLVDRKHTHSDSSHSVEIQRNEIDVTSHVPRAVVGVFTFNEYKSRGISEIDAVDALF